MSDVFDRGDGIRISVTFRDIADAVADPSTVTIRIKTPDATVEIHTLASGDVEKDSQGVYHYDYTITQEGEHYVRWEGTDTVIAVAETSFRARKSKVIS